MKHEEAKAQGDPARLQGSGDLSGTAGLADLAPGQRGVVVGISRACDPAARRRLMDLGVVPDTVIEVMFRSPAGDPVAYRIRGAVIGLRREQAQHVRVTPEGTA